jgi:hypothetical protein
MTCAWALCIELPPEPPIAELPPLPAALAPPELAELPELPKLPALPEVDGMPPKELAEPACETALPPKLVVLPAPPFALPPVLALPPTETPGPAPPALEHAVSPVSQIPSKHVEKRILHR